MIYYHVEVREVEGAEVRAGDHLRHVIVDVLDYSIIYYSIYCVYDVYVSLSLSLYIYIYIYMHTHTRNTSYVLYHNNVIQRPSSRGVLNATNDSNKQPKINITNR